MGISVLTTTRETNKKDSNADAAIEDICVDHINSYENVKQKMKEIKEKFNLTDDTDWRAVMLEVGKRKRDQDGNPKPNYKGKDGQGRREQGKDGKGRDNKGKFGKGRDNKGKQGGKGKAKQTPTKNNKSTEEGAADIATTEDADKGAVAKSPQKQNNNSTKKSPANKKRKDESIPENGTPQAKKAKTEPKRERNTPAKADVPAPPPKVTTEDSFFITANGASYQSTAVVDRIQADGPDDGLARKERRAKQFGKATPDHNRNKFNKSGDSAKLNVSKDTTSNGADHPSWAAKKKQKAIPSFQGKKVKFDNESGSQPQSAPKSADKDVHPSWAAKQKLKPVITEFKGSKITFD